MRLNFAFALCSLIGLAAEVRQDIVYKDGLRLDVRMPDGAGPFPVAILVHGGGWVGGGKTEYIHFIFEPLTQAGIASVSIDYRLAPQHKWPACAEDVEAAIQWTFAHAAEYKFDPARVALVGESAGGHLAAYAGIRTTHKLAAIVSFYGVHDFVARAFQFARIDPNVSALFGIGSLNADTAVVLREASPYTHVRAGLPPFLMIHGTADSAVPYAQSVDMCSKLRSKSVPCELYSVNGPHGMDRWDMDPTLQGYKQKLVDWLRGVFAR